MSQMNRIEVKDLQFSYTGSPRVLKGLTFSLDERPVVLIGQNGAGKTTFVKLLKGLLRPSAGHIYFEGQDIADMTVADLAKDIGLVFQNPDDQIFENTVLDEVMFGPLQIGMEAGQAKAYSLEALKVVGLEGQETTNPYDLSLSDRKMVSIAAVLATRTDAIILGYYQSLRKI
jgi:energy-coupling factor transport system ATP-binding protein